jgi:hypothetical protein
MVLALMAPSAASKLRLYEELSLISPNSHVLLVSASGDTKKPDHRQSRLLRPRGKRPGGGQPHNRFYEFPPSHDLPKARGQHPTTCNDRCCVLQQNLDR